MQSTSVEPRVATDDSVQSLIQSLGARDFATRENAQGKLRRLGLEAFDDLYKAQASDDIEIALRARYLLRSLSVRWSQDDDPVRVKNFCELTATRTNRSGVIWSSNWPHCRISGALGVVPAGPLRDVERALQAGGALDHAAAGADRRENSRPGSRCFADWGWRQQTRGGRLAAHLLRHAETPCRKP